MNKETGTHRPMSKNETVDSSLSKALLSARAVIDKKAEQVKILDLREISGFTEYFVICSGTSDRQVQAISDSVEQMLESNGYELYSSEGHADGRWVLMDFGDIVVHVFLDALREYYDLESLWADAPRVQIPSEFYGSGASLLN